MFKKLLIASSSSAAGLLLAASALAAPVTTNYSLFGGAEYTSPGNASFRAVKLVSDTVDPFSGIDFTVDAGTTFSELTTLMTDFKLEADDTCIGGSPRFQVGLDNGAGDTGNIFIYFGTDSGGAPCVAGVWQNTGDVLETGRLLDTSQLDGGTFYDPYTSALTKYGSYTVTGIQIVTDSSWAALDGEHTVLIDNTTINEVVYNYEPTQTELKNMCKNNGWQTMTDADGRAFKNQGDCVSYFATGTKNKANG